MENEERDYWVDITLDDAMDLSVGVDLYAEGIAQGPEPEDPYLIIQEDPEFYNWIVFESDTGNTVKVTEEIKQLVFPYLENIYWNNFEE